MGGKWVGVPLLCLLTSSIATSQQPADKRPSHHLPPQRHLWQQQSLGLFGPNGGIRFNRTSGLPYWYGVNPYLYDPFLVPLVPVVPAYQYEFTVLNPSLPPLQPPVIPQQPVPDPPAEPKAPAKVKKEPKARDELERRADTQKLIRQGNEAFGKGYYAQAQKHYHQATEAGPLEPMPFFHLAQAQLAQGKFADAGVSIQRGLLLHPEWPATPFEPRALYGDFAANYDKHLGQLADLVNRNKNDDGLLFLLGYQLWFDGKKDEARVLFQRASGLTLHALHVERFLASK